jgi:hypothetical protein
MKICEVLVESQQRAYHIVDIFSSRVAIYGTKAIENLKLIKLVIDNRQISHEQAFKFKIYADSQIKIFNDMIAETEKLLVITSYENANNIKTQLATIKNKIDLIRKNLK